MNFSQTLKNITFSGLTTLASAFAFAQDGGAPDKASDKMSAEDVRKMEMFKPNSRKHQATADFLEAKKELELQQKNDLTAVEPRFGHNTRKQEAAEEHVELNGLDNKVLFVAKKMKR